MIGIDIVWITRRQVFMSHSAVCGMSLSNARCSTRGNGRHATEVETEINASGAHGAQLKDLIMRPSPEESKTERDGRKGIPTGMPAGRHMHCRAKATIFCGTLSQKVDHDGKPITTRARQ